MRKIETVYISVKKVCDVRYYIHCYPFTTPPFVPEKDYIFKRNGKIVYFDTREEAEREVKKHKENCEWIKMEICKKVTPIDDKRK